MKLCTGRPTFGHTLRRRRRPALRAEADRVDGGYWADSGRAGLGIRYARADGPLSLALLVQAATTSQCICSDRARREFPQN